MNIVIDKEFQSLIPALTTDEYRGLEESILSEGCRDAARSKPCTYSHGR